MQIRNFSNFGNFRRLVRTSPRYGQKGSFPIDQSPSLLHNIDPDTGRPMSDIQKLTKLQDAVNQQAFLNSLKEYKSSYLPKDMTDEQACIFLKSRHAQTKSELLAYRDGITRYQIEQNLKEQQRQQSEQLAKENAERDAYFNELFNNYKLSKDSK